MWQTLNDGKNRNELLYELYKKTHNTKEIALQENNSQFFIARVLEKNKFLKGTLLT